MTGTQAGAVGSGALGDAALGSSWVVSVTLHSLCVGDTQPSCVHVSLSTEACPVLWGVGEHPWLPAHKHTHPFHLFQRVSSALCTPDVVELECEVVLAFPAGEHRQ